MAAAVIQVEGTEITQQPLSLSTSKYLSDGEGHGEIGNENGEATKEEKEKKELFLNTQSPFWFLPTEKTRQPFESTFDLALVNYFLSLSSLLLPPLTLPPKKTG